MKQSVVVIVALSVAQAVLADEVYLLNSDGCAAGTGNVTRKTESSFIHNNTYTDDKGNKWGWSDGNDPNNQTDYLIASQNMVRAFPEATGTLWFPGRTLTLDKGLLSVVGNGVDNGIGIGDMFIRVGSLLADSGCLHVYGKITIDASSYGYPGGVANTSGRWYQKGGGPTFGAVQDQGAKQGTYSSRPITHMHATLIAAQPNNVAISGVNAPLTWHSTQKKHYMAYPNYHDHFAFDGDCSAYFATNNVAPKTTVTINTADFGGTFALSNLAQVVVGPDVTTASVRGGIVARDGWLEVQSGKTLDVGDLDFAFAGPESYVAPDGTNTYLETLYDPAVPFEENRLEGRYQRMNWIHNYSWTQKQFRNTIWLGWSEYVDTSLFPAGGTATLRARAATLRDTLVVSDYEGSLFQVGDLTLDGAKLDYSSKLFAVAVTNSLTVLGKVKLTPPSMGTKNAIWRKPLLTLAKGRGHIDLNDFELPEGHDVVRYPLVVESSEAGETLYFENRAYNPLGAEQGYVVLESSEDASTHKERSLYTAGYWSDGQEPHADTNYYAGGVLIASRNGDYTFPGRVLAGWSLRFSGMTSGTLTLKDWRLICSGSPNNPLRIYCDNKDYHPVIAGEMTVVPTLPGYFARIGGGADSASSSLTFASTLHGWTDAILEITNVKYEEDGGARFVGDNSDYRGLFRVLQGSCLTLGGGSMPGTVRLHASDTALAVAGADGATAWVGTLVTTNAASETSEAADVVRVNVAATNALCASVLEINGKLRKLGAGVFGAKAATANALAAEAGAIDVREGFLRTYAPGAFDSVPLNFADGTGVSVDLDEMDETLKETGFRTAGLMTSTGTFKAKIAGDFSNPDQCVGRTVVLMTVPTAFADSVQGNLRVVKPAKGLGAKISRQPAGEGRVKFLATIERTGMLLIVR